MVINLFCVFEFQRLWPVERADTVILDRPRASSRDPARPPPATECPRNPLRCLPLLPRVTERPLRAVRAGREDTGIRTKALLPSKGAPLPVMERLLEDRLPLITGRLLDNPRPISVARDSSKAPNLSEDPPVARPQDPTDRRHDLRPATKLLPKEVTVGRDAVTVTDRPNRHHPVLIRSKGLPVAIPRDRSLRRLTALRNPTVSDRRVLPEVTDHLTDKAKTEVGMVILCLPVSLRSLKFRLPATVRRCSHLALTDLRFNLGLPLLLTFLRKTEVSNRIADIITGFRRVTEPRRKLLPEAV